MATYCMWADKRCPHEKENKPQYCCKCLADEVNYYREKIRNMENIPTPPEEQKKALYNIDSIIMLLDFSAQLGASVTIAKEDVPILLEALEPVVKERCEYWQRFYARFKPFNVGKKQKHKGEE